MGFFFLENNLGYSAVPQQSSHLVRFAILLPARENDARFPADGGKRADAATEKLIAPPRSHDLKVERLVELAELFGAEPDPKRDRVVGGNHPAVADQLRRRGRQYALTETDRCTC